MSRSRYLLPAILACFVSATAHADCEIDTSGVVYCSKYPSGGAVVTHRGHVVCGKGECDRDTMGVEMCSKVEGGGVERDREGMVRCLGGCERASVGMCVKAE